MEKWLLGRLALWLEKTKSELFEYRDDCHLLDNQKNVFLKTEVIVIEGCRQGFRIEFEDVGSPIAKHLNILIKYTLVGCVLFNFFAKIISQEPYFFDDGLDESLF